MSCLGVEIHSHGLMKYTWVTLPDFATLILTQVAILIFGMVPYLWPEPFVLTNVNLWVRPILCAFICRSFEEVERQEVSSTRFKVVILDLGCVIKKKRGHLESRKDELLTERVYEKVKATRECLNKEVDLEFYV